MTQMVFEVSSDLPPPPALKLADPVHEQVYQMMCRLEEGQWFRWPGAPRGFRGMVLRWAKHRSLKYTNAYRDVHGDGIIIHEQHDAKITPEDQDEE